MVRTAILVGTLVALATAIPQHAEHLSKAQITRVNQVFARDNGVFDLAGRGVSTDGSCGTAGGLTCPQGTCCSSLGWCGSTPLHCGTGCQSAFGKCGTDDSSATSPVPVAPASTPVSTPVTVPAANNPTTQNAPAAAAAPVNTSTQQSSAQSTGLGDNYKQYSGDGSTGAGWPSQDQWADFETAFSANKALMKVSCSQFGQANPSDSEIQTIHDSIVSTASASGIDSRYILAIVMQESKGCVRAPTTNWGVRNPGLMQSFNGQGTCNDGGSVQNPCPSSEISQMISDGTTGTGAGSNSLVYALGRAGTSDVSQYYKAARVYNSGSIAGSGQLQDGIATHCYSSDVANRLTGWVNAAHSCSFDG